MEYRSSNSSLHLWPLFSTFFVAQVIQKYRAFKCGCCLQLNFLLHHLLFSDPTTFSVQLHFNIKLIFFARFSTPIMCLISLFLILSFKLTCQTLFGSIFLCVTFILCVIFLVKTMLSKPYLSTGKAFII